MIASAVAGFPATRHKLARIWHQSTGSLRRLAT